MVDIVSMIAATKNAAELLGKAKDLIDAAKYVDLREAIIAARESMLDLRDKMNDLREENESLRNQLREAVQTPMEIRGGVYYLRSDPTGFAFCPNCWHRDNRKSALQDQKGGPFEGLAGRWFCPSCNWSSAANV